MIFQKKNKNCKSRNTRVWFVVDIWGHSLGTIHSIAEARGKIERPPRCERDEPNKLERYFVVVESIHCGWSASYRRTAPNCFTYHTSSHVTFAPLLQTPALGQPAVDDLGNTRGSRGPGRRRRRSRRRSRRPWSRLRRRRPPGRHRAWSSLALSAELRPHVNSCLRGGINGPRTHGESDQGW